MHATVEPWHRVYDDGELDAVRGEAAGFRCRSSQPTDEQRRGLADVPAEPFEHYPWVTIDKVKLQITWTMTNLDPEDHDVELLIDPWNEFGRYLAGSG